EVEEHVAGGAVRPVDRGEALREPLVERRVVELAADIEHALGEPSPLALHRFAAAELAQAGREVAAEALVVLGRPRDADHGERLGQQTRPAQVAQRRHEQAPAESTSAGTASSIAAMIVQRPSPESATKPE